MQKLAIVVFTLSCAFAYPSGDSLMLDMGEDTAVVESTVRETRAAVPAHIEDLLKPGVKAAFLHSYGDVEKKHDNILGYHKKSDDKGSEGYKHFDTYHKKDGDKFEFESYQAFGQKNKENADGKGKSKGHSHDYHHEHGDKDEDEGESKRSYSVFEDAKEGKGNKKAVEDYEGDSGYYADSEGNEGESEGSSEGGEYSEGEESEGDEGEESDDDGESGSYTGEESDDDDSESYAEEEEEEY